MSISSFLFNSVLMSKMKNLVIYSPSPFFFSPFSLSASYLQLSHSENLASVRYFLSRGFLMLKRSQLRSAAYSDQEAVQVVVLIEPVWGSF